MEAFKLQKKYPEVSRDEMFDLINRFKCVSKNSKNLIWHSSLFSSLRTQTPGRVDKSEVLQALQANGQSYDVARETLKHVSVDASGKVELDDWVEVWLHRYFSLAQRINCCAAQCQTQDPVKVGHHDESWKDDSARVECQC
jgi:Ca2+-binding EF-hand superfamily protein